MVGTPVTCLAVDLEHFDSPSLLVGTRRDSTGMGLILRVDPQTLTTIDTLYRSSYVPKVCRAADINLDSETDLVVSLTSVAGDSNRFSSVVICYGPDFASADTLPVPRTAVDLQIDEDLREIWFGYAHDTTTSETWGACINFYWQYIGFGGSVGFDLIHKQEIDSGLAAIAFNLGDVNSDHISDVTALWAWEYRNSTSGCTLQPTPCAGSVGIWRRDGSTLDTLRKTWDQYYSDETNYIKVYPRLLVADLNADGYAEGVLSWHHAVWSGYDALRIVSFSLASGALLWQRVQTYATFGIHDGIVPFTTIIYDIDNVGPPEVLIFVVRYPELAPTRLLALRGDTGDSLFSTTFRYVSSLNLTYQASAGQRARVIHAEGGWLYRWRIDLASAIEPGSVIVPGKFELETPSPNPFNAETHISYVLTYSMDVDLTIFDALGRRVRRLATSNQAAGEHRLVWDGKNDQGQSVSSGVYFLRLASEGEQLVCKMALLK